MTDSIKLYNIDCIEYMKSVPDKYFDLAVVDPPYGIGDTFIGFSSGAKKGKLERIHKEIKWDNATPTDEYFSELKRISKKQIIWGANYFNSFCSGGALIWYKNRGGNTLSQCEIASVSGQKKVDYIPLQILTGFCSNEERIHPTQKPIALYDWILEKYSKPTDKILDTHLGSGSSAIAAHRFGISEFVGCELDKEYFDSACKRFKEQTAQMSML